MTYLSRRADEPDLVLWNVATRWLRPFTIAHLMGEIEMACQFLRSVWQVGRARYLKEPQKLRVFTSPTLDEFIATLEEGVITNRMAMNILYRWPYPPHLRCTECGREPKEGERARRSWRMYRGDDGTPNVVCAECARKLEAA